MYYRRKLCLSLIFLMVILCEASSLPTSKPTVTKTTAGRNAIDHLKKLNISNSLNDTVKTTSAGQSAIDHLKKLNTSNNVNDTVKNTTVGRSAIDHLKLNDTVKNTTVGRSAINHMKLNDTVKNTTAGRSAIDHLKKLNTSNNLNDTVNTNTNSKLTAKTSFESGMKNVSLNTNATKSILKHDNSTTEKSNNIFPAELDISEKNPRKRSGNSEASEFLNNIWEKQDNMFHQTADVPFYEPFDHQPSNSIAKRNPKNKANDSPNQRKIHSGMIPSGNKIHNKAIIPKQIQTLDVNEMFETEKLHALTSTDRIIKEEQEYPLEPIEGSPDPNFSVPFLQASEFKDLNDQTPNVNVNDEKSNLKSENHQSGENQRRKQNERISQLYENLEDYIDKEDVQRKIRSGLHHGGKISGRNSNSASSNDTDEDDALLVISPVLYSGTLVAHQHSVGQHTPCATNLEISSALTNTPDETERLNWVELNRNRICNFNKFQGVLRFPTLTCIEQEKNTSVVVEPGEESAAVTYCGCFQHEYVLINDTCYIPAGRGWASECGLYRHLPAGNTPPKNRASLKMQCVPQASCVMHPTWLNYRCSCDANVKFHKKTFTCGRGTIPGLSYGGTTGVLLWGMLLFWHKYLY